MGAQKDSFTFAAHWLSNLAAICLFVCIWRVLKAHETVFNNELNMLGTLTKYAAFIVAVCVCSVRAVHARMYNRRFIQLFLWCSWSLRISMMKLHRMRCHIGFTFRCLWHALWIQLKTDLMKFHTINFSLTNIWMDTADMALMLPPPQTPRNACKRAFMLGI